MDWEQGDATTKLVSTKEYHCVICNQTTPSLDDKPMGLIILCQVIIRHLFSHSSKSQEVELLNLPSYCFIFQPTSVLSHQRQYPDNLSLPVSEDDPLVPKNDTRAKYFDLRTDKMRHYFDTVSIYIFTIFLQTFL